jgi:hypothetical protein
VTLPAPVTRPSSKPTSPVVLAAGGRVPPKSKHKSRPKGNGGSDPLGLFPSTAISQSTLGQLLSGAREQVQANYAPTALPDQQHYLQPYVDRRDSNLRMAAAAADYLGAAKTNAQNISGAFTANLGSIMNGAQAANAQQGGSAPGVGAIPAAPVGTLGANMVGSSWTNFLNGLIPAQSARASEANASVDIDENKAIADYRAAQAKRTADMQDAIQTLYKGNLDTLKSAKDADYRNALSLYAILGKDKYQQMLLQQRKHEFNVNTGLKRDSLDLSRDKLNETGSYHQATLDLQRKKAAKETGIDTAPALRILNGGKTAATSHIKTGPQGQLGRTYIVAPLLQSADQSPTGQAIFNTKNPRKINVDYGRPVPTGRDAKGNLVAQVSPGDYYYPHSQPGASRGATAASYQQAVSYLRSKYGAKITPAWLKTYFPPPPAS